MLVKKLRQKLIVLNFCKHLKKKFKNKSITLIEDEKKFFEELKKTISPGDNIIFLGAGKSTLIAEKFCNYSGFK